MTQSSDPPVLTVLCGVGRKYPACFLVQLAGRRILLDLGAGAGTAPARPDLSGLGDPVDALLLTHQHPDHLGGLDLLGDLGGPPVFATEPVAAVATERFGVSCRSLSLAGRMDLLGVSVTTGRAGHAPGGVWIHLSDGERTVLYMGDHVSHSVLYPWDPPPLVDLVIVDASYGVESVPQAARVQALMDVLAREPVLLPVPVAGRGLEIALEMMTRGLPLPALCPDLRAMATCLAAGETAFDAGFIRPEAKAPLARLVREAPEADQPDRVTLVSGAVLETPLSLKLAARWTGRGEPVIFTGHIPSQTTALAFVESGRAAWMRWNVHPTLSENIALIRAVKAKVALPAFCDTDQWGMFQAALRGIRVGV
ncbi:MAG: MBL fold metallo-hydrolase [Rhodospirillum sp.]|nr:MBL fold metallo-hydrolase [Rhodospirillum sp.]MCF8488480.1 MBL fold metallo-hydrolase [Rhodospirillum sp.]